MQDATDVLGIAWDIGFLGYIVEIEREFNMQVTCGNILLKRYFEKSMVFPTTMFASRKNLEILHQSGVGEKRPAPPFLRTTWLSGRSFGFPNTIDLI